MTAVEPGQVWRHLTSGWHFEVEHDCADHDNPGWVQLRRLDTQCAYLAPTRFLGTWFELVVPHLPPSGADEVMALAEAAGVVADPGGPRGEQPASEFRVAPFSPFLRLTLSDENLQTVLAGWTTEGDAR